MKVFLSPDARKLALMIAIFALAGAFASTAAGTGAVGAMVAFTLDLIPARFLLAGMFLASCLVSFSVGTSVGTIAALVPVTVGIASETGMDTALLVAAVVGGSFFGDNLSFISDTTIASTQALGCKLKDKFRANVKIAIPALLAVLAIYMIIGFSGSAEVQNESVDYIKLLPYLAVIVLALFGVNVLLILGIGLAMTFATGLLSEGIPAVDWLIAAWNGVKGMTMVICVSLIAAGIFYIFKRIGWMDAITAFLSRRLKGPKGAEFGIAALVSVANAITANNTVAIISCSDISRELTKRFDLEPRKVASILDTFSCLIQGILPYGAQILMASSMAQISPGSIIPGLYYPFALGISAVLGILIGKAGRKTEPSSN